MASANYQDRGLEEILSTHMNGLQDHAKKIEDTLKIKTVLVTNQVLTLVSTPNNEYRVYQSPVGLRNWLASPTPVIKVNDEIVTTGFTIDYAGGAVVFNLQLTAIDVVTADFTHTTTGADYIYKFRQSMYDLTEIVLGGKYDGSYEKTVFVGNIPSGDNIVFTVPPNKKVLFPPQSAISFSNTTGTNIACKMYIVPNESSVTASKQIASNFNVSANSTSLQNMLNNCLIEGDSIVINTNNPGTNVWFRYIEVDASDLDIGYVFVNSLGTSLTTLYTVPAGKRTKILTRGIPVNNSTAGAITLSMHFVHDGELADTINKIHGASISSGTITNLGITCSNYTLKAGDTIQAVGSADGLSLWIPYFEFDA